MNIPYYIQVTYAKLIGPRLELFEIHNHNPFSASARCPLCGDSVKKKTKKRFGFYTKRGELMWSCFNCGEGSFFTNFLRYFDDMLYKAMIRDAFEANGSSQKTLVIPPERKLVINKTDAWKKCVKPLLSSPAKAYVSKRMIPEKHWNRLYYTKNVKHTYVDICDALGLEVDQSKKVPEIEGLFIPFINREGCLVFSTTRNMDESSDFRYAMLEFQPSYKLFGAELVSENSPIYVTEGPIDSLFLDNAIATGDAALTKAVQLFDKDKLVLVPDNEPRAPVQVKSIEKMIQSGFSVVLFPDNIPEKDLNEMFKKGRDVKSIVELNTFKGLQAQLRFKTWKKI